MQGSVVPGFQDFSGSGFIRAHILSSSRFRFRNPSTLVCPKWADVVVT